MHAKCDIGRTTPPARAAEYPEASERLRSLTDEYGDRFLMGELDGEMQFTEPALNLQL